MQIMVADLETGARRLLTNEGSNEDPSWAPDGRHVVFSSRDREGGGLYILDTVSGRVRPLLRGAGYGLPDWSPTLRRAESMPSGRR
jgi:TolB protein